MVSFGHVWAWFGPLFGPTFQEQLFSVSVQSATKNNQAWVYSGALPVQRALKSARVTAVPRI